MTYAAVESTGVNPHKRYWIRKEATPRPCYFKLGLSKQLNNLIQLSFHSSLTPSHSDITAAGILTGYSTIHWYKWYWRKDATSTRDSIISWLRRDQSPHHGSQRHTATQNKVRCVRFPYLRLETTVFGMKTQNYL